MPIQDLWVNKDGQHSKRYGEGLRWRVRVAGYKTTAHRTRAEAERVNAERIAAGPPIPASALSVGELLKVWLESKRSLRPATRTAAGLDARRVYARWSNTLISQLTSQQIQAWVNDEAQTLSGSVVRRMLHCLQSSLAPAVRQGALASNPCDGVTLPRISRHDVTVLNLAQLRLLADSVAWGKEMIWLLGTTGLRVGEACALNVGDVDAKRFRLRVHDSKTGAARDVPISEPVLAMLDLERPPSAPLIAGAQGGRFDSAGWRRRVFNPAVSALAEIPEGFRIHDLRHTAASLAIAAGADVKAVQRMLGHKSAAMTFDLYAHLWDEGLDRVGATIGALIR